MVTEFNKYKNKALPKKSSLTMSHQTPKSINQQTKKKRTEEIDETLTDARNYPHT